MDTMLRGYADAWADRQHRDYRDDTLRFRYDMGYNEGLGDLKKSLMFNRSTVNSQHVRDSKEGAKKSA